MRRSRYVWRYIMRRSRYVWRYIKPWTPFPRPYFLRHYLFINALKTIIGSYY